MLPPGAVPIPQAPLLHYTGVEAFRSIVDKKQIWLTEYKFLNDETEFNYGIGIIGDCINHVFDTIDNDKQNNLLPLKYNIQRGLLINSARTPFVFCLSDKIDDLNQWRFYSEESGRIAIGFDADSLRRSLSLQDTLRLVNMQYDIGEQIRNIDCIIKTSIDTYLDSGAIGQPDLIFSNTLNVISRLIDVAMWFKHGAFSEEREWRLISEQQVFDVSSDLKRTIQFRSGRFGLTPYVAHDFDLSCIKSVWVGPSRHIDLQIQATAAFLKSRGLAHVPVCRSQIPYRV